MTKSPGDSPKLLICDSSFLLGLEASRDGKLYSNDLRERAALAVGSGRMCREVASIFGVSVASVVKWSQRQRAMGSAAAKRMGGHRKRLLEPHRELVLARMREVSHITPRELVAELIEKGIETCPSSVWRLAHSAGMSFKERMARPSPRPTSASDHSSTTSHQTSAAFTSETLAMLLLNEIRV